MDRSLMRKFSLVMRQGVLGLARMDVGPNAQFEQVTERAEAYLKWINEGKGISQEESFNILVESRIYGLTTDEVLRNATLARTWLTSTNDEV